MEAPGGTGGRASEGPFQGLLIGVPIALGMWIVGGGILLLALH